MTFKVGDRVFWNDPDEGTCSQLVTILEIEDEHEGADVPVFVQSEAGDEFPVYRHELSAGEGD